MTPFIPGKFTHTRVRSETFSCMNTLVNITNGDMNAPHDSSITGLSHQPLKQLKGLTMYVLALGGQKGGQVESRKCRRASIAFSGWLWANRELDSCVPHGGDVGQVWREKKKHNGGKKNRTQQVHHPQELYSCTHLLRRQPSQHVIGGSLHGSAPKASRAHTHTHMQHVSAWQQREGLVDSCVPLWIYLSEWIPSDIAECFSLS